MLLVSFYLRVRALKIFVLGLYHENIFISFISYIYHLFSLEYFFFFYCHFFTKKNTGTFGLIFTDVMADTLVVERMKSERHQDVGRMQTLCWCMRFGGNLVGILS